MTLRHLQFIEAINRPMIIFLFFSTDPFLQSWYFATYKGIFCAPTIVNKSLISKMFSFTTGSDEMIF